HLVDIPEPLVIRVRNDLQYQWMINSNKTIDRVVDDLSGRLHCCFFVKGFIRAGDKCTKAGFNKLFLPHPQPLSIPIIIGREGEATPLLKIKGLIRGDYYFFSD